MNCADVKKLLPLYIDDELDGKYIKEIESHISECKMCMKECERLLEVTILLRSISDAPLPESVDKRLKTAMLAARTGRASAGRNRRKMISGIAAALVICIVSVTLYANMDKIMPSRLNNAGELDSSFSSDGKPDPSYNNDAGQFAFGDFGAGETGAGGNLDGLPEAEDADAYDAFGLDAEENAILDEQLPEPPIEEFTTPSDSEGHRDELASSDSPRGLAEPETPVPSQNDTFTADYYLKRLGDGLRGFDYKISDPVAGANGLWVFHVDIRYLDYSTGEEIEIVNKYTYYGQGGELWRE